MAMFEILQVSVSVLTALGALVSILFAFRSGYLKRVRLGPLDFEAPEHKQAAALIKSITEPDREPVPFETEQLAQYYAQVLTQARISFWFSLVFASLGFAVIVTAGFTYTANAAGATVAQVAAGVIMDAVSALFFVQSKTAQTSLGEFFDKLRRDRQQVESRRLCESIQDPTAKDALRVQLALHYAEVLKADEVSRTILDLALSGGRKGNNV